MLLARKIFQDRAVEINAPLIVEDPGSDGQHRLRRGVDLVKTVRVSETVCQLPALIHFRAENVPFIFRNILYELIEIHLFSTPQKAPFMQLFYTI